MVRCETHSKIRLHERTDLLVLQEDWIGSDSREPSLDGDSNETVVYRARSKESATAGLMMDTAEGYLPSSSVMAELCGSGRAETMAVEQRRKGGSIELLVSPFSSDEPKRDSL